MAIKTAKKPLANGETTVPLPEVLTLEEAAAWLRVDPKQLLAEAERGRLPAQFVGCDLRFSRSALHNWLHQPLKTQGIMNKDQILALAGMWKDDPTVDEMMEEIERKRKSE